MYKLRTLKNDTVYNIRQFLVSFHFSFNSQTLLKHDVDNSHYLWDHQTSLSDKTKKIEQKLITIKFYCNFLK